MWNGIGIYATLMVICLANVQAAVIRPEEQQEMEYASTTVEPMDSTTLASAKSRDKDATVEIEERVTLASLDPAPGTIEGDLSVRLEQKPQEQKSAKLLLLSTPAKRPAEVEQQLEEQDEQESSVAGSAETNMPTTTEQEQPESTTIMDNPETTLPTVDRKVTTTAAATTQLFAINATISSEDSSEPNVAVAVATDNATISIAEQPQSVGNNNVAIELALTEPEAEYVLLDTGLELASISSSSSYSPSSAVTHDELQLGSFTHIDSDAHLQPVVHSVEIVPTRFDDPLIVNYVHNFR